MSHNLHKILLNQDNIRFLEAKSNYSMIFLKEEQKLVSKNLKVVIAQLNNKKFCRCHRSFIVNFDYIKQVDLYNNQIVLLSGELLPISRRHKSYVKKFVKDHSTL